MAVGSDEGYFVFVSNQTHPEPSLITDGFSQFVFCLNYFLACATSPSLGLIVNHAFIFQSLLNH